jgi:clan AA aspartic protease (TIGR02281 family)
MSRCPKCRALSGEEDRYCRRCGTRLDLPAYSWFLRRYWPVLAGVALLFFLVFWATTPQRRVTSISPVSELDSTDFSLAVAEPQAHLPSPRPVSAEVPGTLPTVWVRIRDIAGREIAALPAPVVGQGWVALPRLEVLGGAEWEAELPDGRRVGISAGVQADGDAVGLWQLDEVGGMTPPPLAAWDSQAALSWRPLASDDVFPIANQESCAHQALFELCPDSALLATTGVLLQDGSVVGWTFDKSPQGRFLWTGASGDNLQPSLRVSDFYRLSFADGREEQLLLATENSDLTTAERLTALAGAFGRDPRLTPAERRELFAEAPALDLIHQLVDTLLANGQAAAVADSFEGRLLAQLGDPGLSGKVVTAEIEAYGTSRSLSLMEELLYWTPEETDTARLEALYRKVALQTLKELVDADAVDDLYARLTDFTQRFPNSPAIHLYRVEAALLAGDTALARELLAERSYPSDLQDRVAALTARIDEAFALAEGILIPFTPGSHVIETTARLNGVLSQRFLVDTGASLTTIPSATADRLGLSSGSARHREVTTAGGVVTAWEAALDSIVLEDEAVSDLTVLVLDIPDNPDLGLLGMNFIRHFEMDLDNQKGTLMLRPR